MSEDNSQNDEFKRLLQAFKEAQDRGDFASAQAIGAQCLQFAAEEAERNPDESLRLMKQAREHEEAARWDEAEAVYRQILSLAEAKKNAARICRAHQDLASFFAMTGKLDAALREALASLEAARNTGMTPLLSMALSSVFQSHVSKGDTVLAAAIAEEAIRITTTEKRFDTQHARALLMRAQCRLELDQDALAMEDLNAAWQILGPQAEARLFAGVQNCIAKWWELTAQLRSHSKDFRGAAESSGRAVEIRRMISQLPQLAGQQRYYILAKSLQQHSVALKAAGETMAAAEALNESHKIQINIGISIPPPKDGP